MRTRRDPMSGGLIAGTVLLIVGGVFLLRNAGFIRIDWAIIWPAIVIAIGVAIIAGALGGRGRGAGVASVTVPAEGANRLELILRLGAGRFRLRGGSGALVEASASDASIGCTVDRSGDTARVRLSGPSTPWSWGWTGGLEWQMGVASGVPVVLDVQAGAGDFDLDLSGVALASASVSIGAAQLRVVLPRPRGDVLIRVEGGAASLTFAVPAGVEARVRTSGLVSSSGPSETPGYAAASDRVTVSVTGGAASVRVVPGT